MQKKSGQTGDSGGIQNLSDYMRKVDREPLIGLEFVLQYKIQGKRNEVITKYFCDICDLHCDLVSMIEHLSSMKHRKLTLTRSFPYLLRSPPETKEDRTLALRKMALAIEQTRGLQMFKIDSVVRKITMKHGKVSWLDIPKCSVRQDTPSQKQARWIKALQYLESFEIDNDVDASTVTSLTQKLTNDLKEFSTRVKTNPKLAFMPPMPMQGLQGAAIPPLMQGLQGAAIPPPIQGLQGAAIPPPIQGLQGTAIPPPIQGLQGAAILPPKQGLQGAAIPPPIQGLQGAAIPPPKQGFQGSANQPANQGHQQLTTEMLNQLPNQKHQQPPTQMPSQGLNQLPKQGGKGLPKQPPKQGQQVPPPMFNKGKPGNMNLGFLGGPMGMQVGPMGMPGGPMAGSMGMPGGPMAGPMGMPGGPMAGPMGMPVGPMAGPMGMPVGPMGGPMGMPVGPMGGPMGMPVGPLGGPMGLQGPPLGGPMGLQAPPMGMQGGPMGMQGGPMSGPMGGPFPTQMPWNNPSTLAPFSAFPPGPQLPLFPPPPFPPPGVMPAPGLKEQAAPSGGDSASDPGGEDLKFFKKLMNLLSVIPEGGDTSAMASDSAMIKSLFDQEPASGNVPRGQPDSAPSIDNMEDPAKQKILRLLASQDPAAIAQSHPSLMPMASEEENVPPAENAQANQEKLLQLLIQSRKKSVEMEAEEPLPEKQSVVDPTRVPAERKAPISKKPEKSALGDPPAEPLPVDSRPRPYEDYPPGIKSEKAPPEKARPDPPRGERPAEPAPYTRVSLSPAASRPKKERLPDRDSDRGKRKRSPERSHGPRRPFDKPAWAPRERSAPLHDKRPREEEREEDYFAPLPGERRAVRSSNLSVDLLKRIRGKDIFTVSAILSEYVDNRP